MPGPATIVPRLPTVGVASPRADAGLTPLLLEDPLMFRTLTAFVVAVAVLVLAGAPLLAEEKEQKLEGKITCAKCDLGVEDSCQTVIKVGEKVYYFDKEAHKKHHAKVCKEPKDGTVTGTVKKDGDKMVVTVKNVEFK
jgi:hypothetical protein